MKVNEKIFYTVLTLLIGTLGWIWSVTYSRLTSMEKELVSIKLQCVQIQAQMIDRDEVIRIVRQELGLGGGK